jgi:4-amino-4-deoxy-L-arabinose transferase-like glycosyltransferase
MRRFAAHVLAAVFVVSVTFVLVAVSALAKDDPGNHYGKYGNPGNHYGQISNPGHHYGQLRHRQTPPPSPHPNPSPVPLPITHSGPGAVTPSTVYITVPGLTDGVTGSPIPVTVTLPAQNDTSSRFAADSLPANALDWLILLILPALLAVWVLAAAGLTRSVTRQVRFSRAAVPATNSAT